MDIFGVLQLVGGLCLFLFGMDTMGNGLTKASGSKLEQVLRNMTSSVPRGVLLPGNSSHSKFFSHDGYAGRFREFRHYAA